MDYHLTVLQDFGSYRRGDAITDPGEVERILTGDLSGNVLKVPGGTHDLPPPEPDAPAADPDQDASVAGPGLAAARAKLLRRE